MPRSTSATGKGKAKASPGDVLKRAAEQGKPAEDKKEGKNLLGKLNSLGSSDLNSLEPVAMFVAYASTFFSQLS